MIGRAVLSLLQGTTEPGRVWIGNLSLEQVDHLTTAISPLQLARLTQPQLDAIFLDISRILSEGALSINHRKQLAERYGKQETKTQKTITSTTKKRRRGRPRTMATTDSLAVPHATTTKRQRITTNEDIQNQINSEPIPKRLREDEFSANLQSDNVNLFMPGMNINPTGKRGPGRPKKHKDITQLTNRIRGKPGQKKTGFTTVPLAQPTNTLGRDLYRQTPLPPVSQTQITYSIPIPQAKTRTVKRVEQARQPGDDYERILDIVHGNWIERRHFQPLFEATQQLWDITVYAYLVLLEKRSPNDTKVHDFKVMDGLKIKQQANKQEKNSSKFLTDDMVTRMHSLQLGPFSLSQELDTSGL
jgi:hypothetical protein